MVGFHKFLTNPLDESLEYMKQQEDRLLDFQDELENQAYLTLLSSKGELPSITHQRLYECFLENLP